MELRDDGILYRRVVWKPGNAQWWSCRGAECWVERGCVKLAELKPEDRPREHPDGSPVDGKAGALEEGLSCNYASQPNAAIVSRAARQDLEKYRVIGFLVGEVGQVPGLSVRHDPTDELHPAYLADIGPDDSHSLIVPTDYTQLFKAPGRDQLIALSWEVDVATGRLLRRYAEIKRVALG